MSIDTDRSTADWLHYMGDQLRESRIRLDLSQEELSTLANVSMGTIRNLEGGKGSSLSTLIQVLRALKRTDWLAALAPAISISPMQMLKQRHTRQMRVGKRNRDKE
ncbi:helix-turn-helix domain-containing protein [Rugamonas sp. A1-17]|nr:helix-turn-helix domain-containing protein [Rugamonas sp. A1-17]